MLLLWWGSLYSSARKQWQFILSQCVFWDTSARQLHSTVRSLGRQWFKSSCCSRDWRQHSFFNGTCVVCGSIQMQSLKSASFFYSVINTKSEAGNAAASYTPSGCAESQLWIILSLCSKHHTWRTKVQRRLGRVSSSVGIQPGACQQHSLKRPHSCGFLLFVSHRTGFVWGCELALLILINGKSFLSVTGRKIMWWLIKCRHKYKS